MSIVVLMSVKGAPGVTTAAMLLAGCLPDPVVVEADVDGGVLAVRYGLAREPGLTTLAAARSTAPDAWRAHARSAAGVPVVVGPDAPESAEALWRRGGGVIASTLQAADADVLVDAGRGRSGALGPLLDVAARVIVVARAETDELIAASHRLRSLSTGSAEIGLVLSGAGAYQPSGVKEQLGVPVLGMLPHDPRTAAAVAGRAWTGRRLRHGELVRAVRNLAGAIAGRPIGTAHGAEVVPA